jgi:GYF domain 2
VLNRIIDPDSNIRVRHTAATIQNMHYFYNKNGEIFGPATLEEIRRLCRNGQIPHETIVCKENDENWVGLSSLGPIENGEVRKAVATQQPLTASPPPIKKAEYCVVPFIASIGQLDGAQLAADQLQGIIRHHAASGWEYVRLESVETYVAGNNGCFGLGAVPPRVTSFSMIVFKR